MRSCFVRLPPVLVDCPDFRNVSFSELKRWQDYFTAYAYKIEWGEHVPDMHVISHAIIVVSVLLDLIFLDGGHVCSFSKTLSFATCVQDLADPSPKMTSQSKSGSASESISP